MLGRSAPVSLAILTLLGLLTGSNARAGAPIANPAAASLQTAPDFSRPTLDGAKLSLSALRGKVVLLNFWATWCGPCLEEIPQFAQWQKNYARSGLQIVGISMDDDAAPVREADKKFQLDYPIMMGDEKLAESYGGVYGLPVTFLIDRNGRIRGRWQGATDLNQVRQEIEHLLSQH